MKSEPSARVNYRGPNCHGRSQNLTRTCGRSYREDNYLTTNKMEVYYIKQNTTTCIHKRSGTWFHATEWELITDQIVLTVACICEGTSFACCRLVYRLAWTRSSWENVNLLYSKTQWRIKTPAYQSNKIIQYAHYNSWYILLSRDGLDIQ